MYWRYQFRIRSSRWLFWQAFHDFLQFLQGRSHTAFKGTTTGSIRSLAVSEHSMLQLNVCAWRVMKCLKKQSIFNPVSSFYCCCAYRQTDTHHLLLYKDDIRLCRAAAGVVILTSGSKWRHGTGDKISQEISVYKLKCSLSMIYWLHLGKYITSYFVRSVLMIPGRRTDDIVTA